MNINRVNYRRQAAADDRAEIEWRLQLRPMTHKQRGGMTTQFRKSSNDRPHEIPPCASPSKPSLSNSKSAPNIRTQNANSDVATQQYLPILNRKIMFDGSFRNYTMGNGGIDCVVDNTKEELPML